ncbi:MAG: hypothetical protein JRJ82_07770 [Deltaproteobacteria bacterium]|nr:hypothetical protein [Deltaproteobacteria bacterium]
MLIEHQCPQCGAPATLEETDHLFTCGFCRVKSYLLSSVYQYLLPHSAPEGKDLIYFPYWRFKGMLFSCTRNGIKHRIVDVSHQGIPSTYFPVSLGLRSQTQKLRFVSPETKGLFLKPSFPHKEVIEIIEERFSAKLPKPIYNQSFVGETLSILYSPFYADAKVFDAVLNRPVSPELPEDFDITSMAGGSPEWQVQFIVAQCPDCGWDLEGEKDSLALNCKNCETVWQSGKGRFMKLTFGHIPEEGGNLIYLPFWRIRGDISGIQLNSYADLVKVANLPKVVQEEWKEQGFRFWAPAFKIRPENFLTFSRNLTLSQPQEEVVKKLPEAPLYPVTLSITEAVESLRLTMASFVKPQRTMLPKIPNTVIKPKSFILVYIPFHEKGNELTQPAFRLRLNKNLLAFAKHL